GGSSSSDRGSKLRGPPQNSPRVASKRDVNITKLNSGGSCSHWGAANNLVSSSGSQPMGRGPQVGRVELISGPRTASQVSKSGELIRTIM
ncbi:hypothetical protein AVEN_58601-1, partial [Araneus ventricosus]